MNHNNEKNFSACDEKCQKQAGNAVVYACYFHKGKKFKMFEELKECLRGQGPGGGVKILYYINGNK